MSDPQRCISMFVSLGLIWLAPIFPTALPQPLSQSRPDTGHPQLYTQKGSVKLGEETSVTWDTGNAVGGYLSYIGAVPPRGETKLKLGKTRTYTLIVETPGGPETQSVTIFVEDGGRGTEFTTDETAFQYPINGTTRKQFTELAVGVHAVLQEQLNLSVEQEEFDPSKKRLVYITTRMRDPNLVKPEELRIGARRVAYSVTINPGIQAGTLDYTVKTLVEYRLRVEETWRPERRPTFTRPPGSLFAIVSAL